MVKKAVVLVSGSGTNLQALIDKIKEGYLPMEIAAVISDREGIYALERAKQNNIPFFVISKNKLGNLFYEELLKTVKKINPDVIILAGFLTILNEKFIDEFPFKIINIHPSLIPSFCGKGYYGMKVHRAVIEYGVKYTGCTVHFVDSGTDTGPIIFQEVVKVEDDDTEETISKKVLEKEHELLPKAVKYFLEGRLKIEGRKVFIQK